MGGSRLHRRMPAALLLSAALTPCICLPMPALGVCEQGGHTCEQLLHSQRDKSDTKVGRRLRTCSWGNDSRFVGRRQRSFLGRMLSMRFECFNLEARLVPGRGFL